MSEPEKPAEPADLLLVEFNTYGPGQHEVCEISRTTVETVAAVVGFSFEDETVKVWNSKGRKFVMYRRVDTPDRGASNE